MVLLCANSAVYYADANQPTGGRFARVRKSLARQAKAGRSRTDQVAAGSAEEAGALVKRRARRIGEFDYRSGA